MSEWRYILKRTVGRGRNAKLMLASNIKRAIKRKNLSIELPVMKIEKTSSTEFYIGLAVNDERCGDERVPDYVYDLFSEIGQPLSEHDQETWPTPPSQVDGFLVGGFELDYLTTPLVFERIGQIDISKSLLDAEELEPPDCREKYDQLLWWVSSKGSGTIEQIAETAGALGLIELEGSIWAVVKKLSLLGHLEVYQSEGRNWIWRVAPPTIVENSARGIAYLTGARDGRIQKTVLEERLAVVGETNGGPTRILMQQDRIDDLKKLTKTQIRHIEDPPLRWAELLPELDAIIANLVPEPAIESEPHQYCFEIYSGGSFQPHGGVEFQPGLYRATRQNGHPHPKNVLRTPQGRWLNGDYASLRFFSLAFNKIPPLAHLDSSAFLCIPMQQRWPALYERAIVLASGKLAKTLQTNSGKMLSYDDVPVKAAQEMASKLKVKLSIQT